MATADHIKNALAILNIQSDFVTKDEIREVYRQATFKYHPDRNLAGFKMMQLVNIAYETLKDFEGETTDLNKSEEDFGDIINNALNAIIDLGLEVEVYDYLVWVSGNTILHEDALKAAGFFCSPVRPCWYFCLDDYESNNCSTWQR